MRYPEILVMVYDGMMYLSLKPNPTFKYVPLYQLKTSSATTKYRLSWGKGFCMIHMYTYTLKVKGPRLHNTMHINAYHGPMGYVLLDLTPTISATEGTSSYLATASTITHRLSSTNNVFTPPNVTNPKMPMPISFNSGYLRTYMYLSFRTFLYNMLNPKVVLQMIHQNLIGNQLL